MQLQRIPIAPNQGTPAPAVEHPVDDSPDNVQVSIDELNEKTGNLLINDASDDGSGFSSTSPESEDEKPDILQHAHQHGPPPPGRHHPHHHNHGHRGGPPPHPPHGPHHHGHPHYGLPHGHHHHGPRHGHHGHRGPPPPPPHHKHKGPRCLSPGDKAHRHHRAHSPPGWAGMKSYPRPGHGDHHAFHPGFDSRRMHGGHGGRPHNMGDNGASGGFMPFEADPHPPPPPPPAHVDNEDAWSVSSDDSAPHENNRTRHFGGGFGHGGPGGHFGGMGRGGMRGHGRGGHHFHPGHGHMGPPHHPYHFDGPDDSRGPPPFGPFGHFGPQHHFGPPGGHPFHGPDFSARGGHHHRDHGSQHFHGHFGHQNGTHSPIPA